MTHNANEAKKSRSFAEQSVFASSIPSSMIKLGKKSWIFWQNFHLLKQRKTWSNWNNSSIETTVDLANFWLRTYKTFLILVVFSVNVCIGHIKLKRIMKKKKQKKNITKTKKTIPIKVIKRSWYNMWKLLTNFAAELCNYHKQNYLTKKNKRQRISYCVA